MTISKTPSHFDLWCTSCRCHQEGGGGVLTYMFSTGMCPGKDPHLCLCPFLFPHSACCTCMCRGNDPNLCFDPFLFPKPPLPYSTSGHVKKIPPPPFLRLSASWPHSYKMGRSVYNPTTFTSITKSTIWTSRSTCTLHVCHWHGHTPSNQHPVPCTIIPIVPALRYLLCELVCVHDAIGTGIPQEPTTSFYKISSLERLFRVVLIPNTPLSWVVTIA